MSDRLKRRGEPLSHSIDQSTSDCRFGSLSRGGKTLAQNVHTFFEDRQPADDKRNGDHEQKDSAKLVYRTRTQEDDNSKRSDDDEFRQQDRAAAGNCRGNNKRESCRVEEPVAIGAAIQRAIKKKRSGDRRVENHPGYK